MKKVLIAAAVFIVLGLLIFFFGRCDRGDETAMAALQTANSDLSARNVTLAGQVDCLNSSFTEVKKKLDKAKREASAAQKENATLKAELADHEKWYRKWKVANDALTKVENRNKALGEEIKALQAAKDEFQREKERALEENIALDNDLAALRGKAMIALQKAEEGKHTAVARVTAELKSANFKISGLEKQIAVLQRENASLKTGVLSAGERAAKIRTTADSFRACVVLTANCPNHDLDLDKVIRDKCAELLPKTYSLNDEELFREAEPVMKDMPQQDGISSVLKLHTAWRRWKEIKTRYNRIKSMSPAERKASTGAWLEENRGEASS